MKDDELRNMDPVKIPIDGILDLHPFRPKETISVLEEYIDCCVSEGIPMVRIIHGKGIGVQKERVHSFLKKSPYVLSYGIDTRGPSGWGATVATLKVSR